MSYFANTSRTYRSRTTNSEIDDGEGAFDRSATIGVPSRQMAVGPSLPEFDASVAGRVDRIRGLPAEILRDVRGVETTPRSDVEHLEAAIDWLYRSQDVTGCGGSASTYNLVLGWGAAYPETTGYIIPTLCEYAHLSGSPEARQRAEEMASWLLSIQSESGSFPAGTAPTADSTPSVFNTGQIIFGLLRTYDETGNARFLEAARQASDWLVSVQRSEGYWDQYDYRNTVHSYTARVGWALLETYDRTGIDAFRAAGRSNLRWVTEQQHENGWFSLAAFDRSEDPYLHTLAYTIRGLLEGAVLLGDDELVTRARESADAFLGLQRRTGILTGQYDEQFSGPDFYCLTGNAQMAVIWYRLFQERGDPAYRHAADETLAFLKRKQRLSGPDQLRGGLKGSDPIWQRYMYLRYPNWAVKFLADALLHSIHLGES